MLVASQAAGQATHSLTNLTDRLAQSALARLRRGLRWLLWRWLLWRWLLWRLCRCRLLRLGWPRLRGRLLRLVRLIRWHGLCILGVLVTLREILVRHLSLLHKSDRVWRMTPSYVRSSLRKRKRTLASLPHDPSTC